MTEDRKKDELKPCPFCGFQEPIRNSEHVSCRNSGCIIGFVFFREKEWNNADCWKELSKRDEELKAKDAEIERLLTSRTTLTFKCKCGKEINTSPLPLYEAMIKEKDALITELRLFKVCLDCAEKDETLRRTTEGFQSTIKRLCLDQQMQIDSRDATIKALGDALEKIADDGSQCHGQMGRDCWKIAEEVLTAIQDKKKIPDQE